MNNNQFTQKVVSMLAKSKKDKFGFVAGKFQIIESKAGGINFRHSESCAKSLMDGIRRNEKKAGKVYSFATLCERIAKAKTIEDVLLNFRFDGEGKQIAIDAKRKQAQIASLSTRIKKAYAPMFGVNEKAMKGLNLSGPQTLQIVQESAQFFLRVSQRYVAPIKPVVVKKAAKVKPAPKAKAKAAKA